MTRSNTAAWLLTWLVAFVPLSMCLLAIVAALLWASGGQSDTERADTEKADTADSMPSAESTPDAPAQRQEARAGTPVEEASETDHATDRAADETLDLNERPPDPGDKASQPVDVAGDRERVEDASNSATGETLDLHWLRTLDAAAAEKLAQWERGESGRRTLRLRDSARRAVDAADPGPLAAEQAQPASEQAQRTPVPISTCAELQAMQNDLAGHYVLVNDIDCSGFDFEPVGSEESPFTGTLDGQGFVISDLSIDRPSDDLVGLFRVARSATIRNLHLGQPVVTGDWRVGALLGRVIGGTVRNVHVGDGRISGRDNIGGLAGRSDESTLEHVSTSGFVRGNEGTSNSSPYFGGLIGYSIGTSLLRSHSSADVHGKSGWKIGGLVGQLSQGTLSECFSTGQVDGWARVGGLAGHIQGSSAMVSDCYACGDVTGTQQVGGFVGLTYRNPTITRSYATGHVTGRTDTGGFLGRGLGGTLSACFWDASTSGHSGDNAPAGTTGLPTRAMQTEETFNRAGWDLEGTWRLVDYPRLDHATDRATEEPLDHNERELDLGDRAPRAVEPTPPDEVDDPFAAPPRDDPFALPADEWCLS